MQLRPAASILVFAPKSSGPGGHRVLHASGNDLNFWRLLAPKHPYIASRPAILYSNGQPIYRPLAVEALKRAYSRAFLHPHAIYNHHDRDSSVLDESLIAPFGLIGRFLSFVRAIEAMFNHANV
ncbi:hypothetical protein CISG_09722 [Coccidioides immitis RMSCC 3703]|uniref:Uncharacterized protein n=1 Tax=Coccidioides immitis RMSCC 3703 TaxID=454286 RepID=A0A0J8QNS0_COCIT|nr:hypothetical protein CISG_09722 [Coccidioides immitis RMSCC 3703]